MQTASVKLYTFSYRELRTYVAVALFVAGNIILPQLCHLIPQGGLIWLPIYFFTLIAAYKYGWQAGVLTAVLSPTVNSLLFGMPPAEMLPIILTKSLLLATAASLTAHYARRVSLLLLAAVVVAYQTAGGLAEWAMTGSLQAALQDFCLGLPGILFQIAGGWLFLKYLLKK